LAVGANQDESRSSLAEVVFFTKNKLKNLSKPPIGLSTSFDRKLLNFDIVSISDLTGLSG
jgi:hypothetical protein